MGKKRHNLYSITLKPVLISRESSKIFIRKHLHQNCWTLKRHSPSPKYPPLPQKGGLERSPGERQINLVHHQSEQTAIGELCKGWTSPCNKCIFLQIYWETKHVTEWNEKAQSTKKSYSDRMGFWQFQTHQNNSSQNPTENILHRSSECNLTFLYSLLAFGISDFFTLKHIIAHTFFFFFFSFNSLFASLLTLSSSSLIPGPLLHTLPRSVLAESQQRSVCSDICRNKHLWLEQAGTLICQPPHSTR